MKKFEIKIAKSFSKKSQKNCKFAEVKCMGHLDDIN